MDIDPFGSALMVSGLSEPTNLGTTSTSTLSLLHCAAERQRAEAVAHVGRERACSGWYLQLADAVQLRPARPGFGVLPGTY
jgi:hypothetical protein